MTAGAFTRGTTSTGSGGGSGGNCNGDDKDTVSPVLYSSLLFLLVVLAIGILNSKLADPRTQLRETTILTGINTIRYHIDVSINASNTLEYYVAEALASGKRQDWLPDAEMATGIILHDIKPAMGKLESELRHLENLWDRLDTEVAHRFDHYTQQVSPQWWMKLFVDDQSEIDHRSVCEFTNFLKLGIRELHGPLITLNETVSLLHNTYIRANETLETAWFMPKSFIYFCITKPKASSRSVTNTVKFKMLSVRKLFGIAMRASCADNLSILDAYHRAIQASYSNLGQLQAAWRCQIDVSERGVRAGLKTKAPAALKHAVSLVPF